MKILSGRDPVVAHADFPRRLETRVALVDRAVLHRLQPGLDSRARLPGDAVLPRLDPPHIDAHAAADTHAEFRRAPRHVRGIGARHHRLGRDAAGIDAGAAEQLALDDRDLHSRCGQAPGEGGPGLSGTDNDRVEILRHAESAGDPNRAQHRDGILQQGDRKILSSGCPHQPGTSLVAAQRACDSAERARHQAAGQRPVRCAQCGAAQRSSHNARSE